MKASMKSDAVRPVAAYCALGLLLTTAASPALSDSMLIWPPGMLPQSPSQPSYSFEQEFESLGTDDGSQTGASSRSRDPESTRTGDLVPITTGRTDQIVDRLDKTTRDCTHYRIEYRLDCLRDGLSAVMQSLPAGGDYNDMKVAIATAVAELDAIVAANADPAYPPTRRSAVTRDGKRSTTATPIQRIRTANVARAHAQAAVVLDTLSTKLLRSASSSATKRVNYERAAQAINSTKVLLRSA